MTKNFELTEGDLRGFTVEALLCNQCGGAFCGLRTGRVYKGKPVILCCRKEETKEVLEHLRAVRPKS